MGHILFSFGKTDIEMWLKVSIVGIFKAVYQRWRLYKTLVEYLFYPFLYLFVSLWF